MKKKCYIANYRVYFYLLNDEFYNLEHFSKVYALNL